VNTSAWRPGYNAPVAKLCPHADACAGGTTNISHYNISSDQTCTPHRGLTGAYCQLCAEPTSHFFDAIAAQCMPCGASLAYSIVVVVLVIAIIASLVAGWRKLLVTRRRLAIVAERISFRAKLRVAISFYQIVTQLDAVYSLRYPAAYRALLGALSIVNLHVFNWIPGLHAVCFGLSSLSAQLLFIALAPLGVALAAFPIAKFALRHPPTAALPFVLGWTFLLFPTISSRGFRALAPCDCFGYLGDDSGEICFLREDYAVECTGKGPLSAPPSVLAAAWTAIAIWAVGVPLLYVVLLAKEGTLSGSLGLLVGDYRAAASAWELVAIAQKLVLVGFLSLFDPGQWAQLFVAVIVALLAFMLQARVAPYKVASDNLFAFLSSGMLLLVLFGSLGLQTEALAPLLPVDPQLEVAVLFVATLAVIVLALTFFVAEVYAAREPTFQLMETRRQPELTQAVGKRWHLFLSHQWDNQDAVATIKRQLQLLLPGIQVFLDVDNLESIDQLEAYVEASTCFLLLLGSPRYFTSTNCLREVAASKSYELPLVPVHDSDPSKKGAPLDDLKATCPAEHCEHVFGTANNARAVTPWHRVHDFQICSLRLIAEQLLHALPTYRAGLDLGLHLPGALVTRKLRFESPVVLRVNAGAEAIAQELASSHDGIHLASDERKATHFLLYLNDAAFRGDGGALAADVRRRRADGTPIVMVHENDPTCGGCTFGDIMEVTPGDLLESGLYGSLAIAWHPGAFRAVSVRLVWRALGAQSVSAGAWLRRLCMQCKGGSLRRAVIMSERSPEDTDGTDSIEMLSSGGRRIVRSDKV